MYRIFSVEPTENNGSSLAEIRDRLSGLGYELICHQGGADVLDEIKAQQPDLVLVDPTLPDQHSYLICEALKNDSETENIPVIFVHTGQSVNGALLKSFESGATDFISVEVGEIEMLARMNAAIRGKQVVSQSVALAQQLNKMNAELYERNLQVEKELYVARQLQQSLLPPFLPDEEHGASHVSIENSGEPTAPLHFSKCHYRDEKLKISGVYLPCDALGGDIYDVIKFPSGDIGVTIADVSGHGVPAGFITAIFKSSFYRNTHSHSAPGDILHHLNNELADIIKTGEYVTAVYCRIRNEEATGRLVLDYSGAGHPYPAYYNAAEDRIIRLQENGTPLVWIKNMEYPMGTITLEPGDKLLLFTDGVTEMRNIHNALYGEEALDENFLRLAHEQPNHILDAFIQHLSDYTEGHPLEDDVSVVLIEAL
jgi:sigma-B regulation protein RsbU (phosphoserine phosphatase)